MKKHILYLLIFVVSFAYSYNTIEYLSSILDNNTLAHIDNFCCEEENEESKESSEEGTESNLSDEFLDVRLQNKTSLAQTKRSILIRNQNTNFSPSNYSQVIYSPPELI